MNEGDRSCLCMIEALRHNFKRFAQLCPNVAAVLKFAADGTS